MSKGRMEAFSDGVLAIIITIMVLEIWPPHSVEPGSLMSLVPVLLSYVLSYFHLGIYWNNHHHLFQASHRVNGVVLWANLHLLFWLSLFPFVTAWMGENSFASWPVAVYGLVLMCAGFAYYLLSRALIALHGADSPLAAAVGRDFKGITSVVVYLLAIPLAFVSPESSCGLYAIVAAMWLIPDRRIERVLAKQGR